ncbi:SDR family oxidoreductase [Virgibacillus xinjiangensis]|uniref:SDR family oxidoreductase n=1 Tax=Virgibacillus xinjiangensis TaxID=393090 RepID=A0ABV7CV10_9BACI
MDHQDNQSYDWKKDGIPFGQQVSLKKLKDQVIVITGASSGVGLVTARKAAAQGAKVVLAARNEEALKQLTDELNRLGHEAVWVKADVGKSQDVQRIADTAIDEFGGFDTWVNNAGITIFGRAMDVSEGDIKRMFDTTFWGVVYGSRAAVTHFKERGSTGALINVGSIFGDVGTVIQSTYSAAKHAVHGWTNSLRMELEAEQAPISITLVHPGRIDTPYNEHAGNYMEEHPAHGGMIYPPDAIAEAILHAAEHPKRDMYVGSQAKIASLLGTLAPRLTDKVVEAYLSRTQHKNVPVESPEPNALYQAGYGLHERGTNVGHVRSSSLYMKASKYSGITAVAALGIGALLFAASGSRRRD